MISWAKQLGLTEAANLLQETLDEEKANDGLLTEIAERASNPEASNEESEDDSDDQEEEAPKEPPAPKAKRKPRK